MLTGGGQHEALFQAAVGRMMKIQRGDLAGDDGEITVVAVAEIVGAVTRPCSVGHQQSGREGS